VRLLVDDEPMSPVNLDAPDASTPSVEPLVGCPALQLLLAPLPSLLMLSIPQTAVLGATEQAALAGVPTQGACVRLNEC
jgi:hypothetical protein